MRLFVISAVFLFVLTIEPSTTSLAQKPKPCECACGGQIDCPRGTTGYCECKDGQCTGGCLSRQDTGNQLAATILTKITGKKVTSQQFMYESNQLKFSKLLKELIDGETGEGVYKIVYESREMKFSLTPESVDLIKNAQKGLVNPMSGASKQRRP